MLETLVQLTDTLPTHLRRHRVRRGAAATSRPDVRYADLGNTLIRYRQNGSGPSLVLATDPPVPLEMYDDLIQRLAGRFRVTVFEFPGFGGSLPRAGYRFSMQNAVHSAEQFLEHLGHGPHVLAFPCMAGFVSIALARKRPELVDKLLMIQTPDWQGAQAWLAGRDPKGILRTPILGQIALARVRHQRAGAWYKSALGPQGDLERFTSITRENFDHGGCFCLASAFQDFLSDDQGLLGQVEQPALVVWGDVDPSHKHTQPEAIQALVPNSRMVHMPQAGHFPELENTKAVVDLVRSSF